MTQDLLPRLQAALQDRYRIEHPVGAGGMATVYLAHDLKHDRRVAVKVLRPELAAVLGAERFLNEIKVTANLQHPHILPLHDSGEADSFLYYVMPFVEGESLRDKLNREKQLPIEESIEITKSVASALDYAHRHNVIHRDIKPENILIHDGQPVVADFGIALAVSAAAGARLTETGLSLGTPQYMSPEQATGDREIDGRSDIYSLACVLYEMLAGEPPHTGPTVQAVIAKVVTDRPRPLTELRDTVPVHVAAAVHKALAKLPADRFSSAADFATSVSDPSVAAALHVPISYALTKDQARRAGIYLGLAVSGWVIALFAIVLALWPDRQRHAAEGPVRRWNVLLPDSLPAVTTGGSQSFSNGMSVGLSPDGSKIAYLVQRGADTELAIRSLDDTLVTVLPGTAGAWGQILFSPDGQHVAFYVGTELRRIAVSGGPVVPVASVGGPFGTCWGPEGRILVASEEGLAPLWLSVSGGESERVPSPVGERLVMPDLLPNSQTALVTWLNKNALAVLSLDDGTLRALSVDGVVPLTSIDQSRVLFGRQAKYVPSGHIVYMRRDGVVMAVPFDPDELRVLGEPTPVLDGVRVEAQSGVGQVVLSHEGTLVYAPGVNASFGRLAWVDRVGGVDTLPFEPRVYGGFDLSQDGRRLGVQIHPAAGPPEIWTFDLKRSMPMRVPTRGPVRPPVWWPGAHELVYSEYDWHSSKRSVIRQRFTTTWDRDTLPVDGWVQDVSPDGAYLAVSHSMSAPGVRLVSTSDYADEVVVDPHPGAWAAAFSPDGRWLAYNSDESGWLEVIVVRIPFDGHRLQVSSGGGEPLWTPAGDQLIYRDGRNLMALDVPEPGSTQFGSPRLFYDGPLLDVDGRGHDISPDGQRLLVVLGHIDQTFGHLNVITNWFAELERLAPPTRN